MYLVVEECKDFFELAGFMYLISNENTYICIDSGNAMHSASTHFYLIEMFVFLIDVLRNLLIVPILIIDACVFNYSSCTHAGFWW